MIPLPEGQKPRQWQIDAMSAAREGLQRWRSVIISAATGTGKGSLIAAIAVLAARKGRRTLILAHREELVTEIPDRIRAIPQAPPVGVVMAGSNEVRNPIVSASVQSLTKARLRDLGRIDLVITDECHHATAPTYQAVYDHVASHNENWRHLGFTATPFRAGTDGTTRGLGGIFEAVIYEYGIRDAIASGDLVGIRALQVSTDIEITSISGPGDFNETDLTAAIDIEARNDLIASKYRELCDGQPALCFAASVSHAQHLAEAFKRQGIRAAAVWGQMPRDDRRDLIRLFKQRPDLLPVLCSKDLLFEGFDAPQTSVILKARPTKSLIVFQQMIGRGLRLHPGKDRCLFIDFVDNGCELDLATIQDLSEQRSTPERRPIMRGDRVCRRHHEDWGVGIVHAADGSRADVTWPRGRGRLSHPMIELYRAPIDRVETRAAEIVIDATVSSVRTYEVLLLDGSETSDSGIGWYAYQRTLTAGGSCPDGSRLTAHVSGAHDDWSAWLVEKTRDAPDSVSLIAAGLQRDQAISKAERTLRARACYVQPYDAQWRGQAATRRQVEALRKWRIRRDLASISRGEASALLDAVIARAKVRGARGDGR